MMMKLTCRLPTCLLVLTVGTTLACGGGGGTKDPVDPGKLWVMPSPAFMTPGARLVFSAVPEVNAEAPYINTAAWSVVEPNGGSVQANGRGETATYTAPANLGTFHLKAVSEYGTSRYVPQAGTIQIVDQKGVSVSVYPASFTLTRGSTGAYPKPVATVNPLTNHHVLWSVVEPGFEGPNLIRIQTDDQLNTCLIVYNDTAIDNVPGTLFHIRAQSVEVPTAFALVEFQVQR
ncbi:MAG: hypothetical protein IPP78_07705 [Holophagaceae bacterium]|nr:hypothetical protein [Holophagaceae bacterium]